MTRLGHFLLSAGSALAILSCASAPRPRALDQADAARQGTAVRQAQDLAPQMHARAELLRRRAEQAHQDGDMAGAQILAEQALAAYTRAVVNARLAKAKKRYADAKLELAKLQRELDALDEKQARVGAEAEALEMRIKVAQDAIPLSPNGPTTPQREKARLQAARALTSQAELLCLAAHLIQPQASAAKELEASRKLAKTLAGAPHAVPIDDAIRLRSTCLSVLSKARRDKTRAAPQQGKVDALLEELSRSGKLHPFRDDRGVVLTLRDVLNRQGKIPEAAKEVLTQLGRAAKAHPDFPLLIVFHGPGAHAPGSNEIAATLKQAGAARVETADAGTAQPVLPAGRSGAANQNTRVEIVFVAPTH